MIVPRNIILWSALLLPFSAAAPHSAACGGLLYILGGGLLIAAIVDAVAVATTAGKISVWAGDVQRLFLGNQGKIVFSMCKPDAFEGELVFLPFLPDNVGALSTGIRLILPQGGNVHFGCECVPFQRGNYKLERSVFEIRSPWGLWSFKKGNPLNSEIRIYPDTNMKKNGLASLLMKNSFLGSHLNKVVGDGREFEKMREYVNGDSYDKISWKTTAKRGRPVCKEFQVERSQDIYAVIDASRFSGRIKNGCLCMDHYFSAALALGRAAEKQGDRFGIIIFNDQPRLFIKPGSGPAHYRACREAIYALKPELKSPDFENLFSFIKTNVRKRALLMFLTDLDERTLAETFTRNVPLVGRRHLCFVNMLKDKEIAPLFEYPVSFESDIYERLAGHVKWAGLVEVQRLLAKYGAGFSISESETFSTQLIKEYMDMKRRQMI